MTASKLYVVDTYGMLRDGDGKRTTTTHPEPKAALSAYEAAVAPAGALHTDVRLLEINSSIDPSKLPTTPNAWFIWQPGVIIRRHKTIMYDGEVMPTIYDYIYRNWPEAVA